MFACNSVSWHRILGNINSCVTVILWFIVLLLLLMLLMCYAMNKFKLDMILLAKFAFQITYEKGKKIKEDWGSWSQEHGHKVTNNGLERCPGCGHTSWAVPVTLEGEEGNQVRGAEPNAHSCSAAPCVPWHWLWDRISHARGVLEQPSATAWSGTTAVGLSLETRDELWMLHQLNEMFKTRLDGLWAIWSMAEELDWVIFKGSCQSKPSCNSVNFLYMASPEVRW